MKAMMHGEDDTKEGQKPEDREVHSQARNFGTHARFLKIYAYMSNREPLIGLQHVMENIRPDNSEPRFTCDLCEYCSELGSLIEHLNGFEHRKAYIAKKYPFLLKVPPNQNEDRVTFLRRMALDIERDEGVKMYKSEILQDDALYFQKTFEIDSDEEALSIMTLTQTLSETLKTYCLQKTNDEKAENVVNTPGQVNALNTLSADSLGRGNPQRPFGRTDFQPAQSVPVSASQFAFPPGRSGDAMSSKPIGNQPTSFGRISNDSELRPFAPNEPRGSGGFPSESHAFGNKYNPSDRGPLPGSLAGGPSPHSINHVPEYQAYRNLSSTPANIGGNTSWVQDPKTQYDRDHGSRYPTTSGGFSDALSSTYTSGSSNPRINLGFPKNLNTNSVDPVRTSITSDTYRGLPRTMADADRRELWQRDTLYNRSVPVKGATSVLAADILALIKGKDVKSASNILNSLAPTHPAMQKVNISQLLNLLVQTGTIH